MVTLCAACDLLEARNAVAEVSGKNLGEVGEDTCFRDLGIEGLEVFEVFGVLGVPYHRFTSGGNINCLKSLIKEMAQDPNYCGPQDKSRYAHLITLSEVRDSVKLGEMMTPRDAADMNRYFEEKL